MNSFGDPHHRRLRFRLRRPHRPARALRARCRRPASPFSATRPACPTAPSPAAPSPATPRRARSSWSASRARSSWSSPATPPARWLSTPFRMPCRFPCWASSSPAPQPPAPPRAPATCWSSPPTPPCTATPTQPPAAPTACAPSRKPARCWCRWSRRDGPIIRSPPRSSASISNELSAEAAAQGLNPDTLVLGCTHYPLLRPLFERAVRPASAVIDSAEAAAETALRQFGSHFANKPVLAGT